MAKKKVKDKRAVELGRRGGIARDRNLSKEQKSEISRKGGKAYWEKYPEGDPKRRKSQKRENNEKLRRAKSDAE